MLGVNICFDLALRRMQQNGKTLLAYEREKINYWQTFVNDPLAREFSVDSDIKVVTLFPTVNNVEYGEVKKKELHNWADKIYSVVLDSSQNKIEDGFAQKKKKWK